MADARSKPFLEERIKLLSIDTAILREKISLKDKEILNYEAKEGNYESIIQALKDQKGVLLDQEKVFHDQIDSYERMLRKERRKRFWTAAGGIVTTGLAAYLYITK
jgi:hypothetical protein